MANLDPTILGRVRSQGDRLRTMLFDRHADWCAKRIVSEQHDLAKDIEISGLQEQLKYLYQGSLQSNVGDNEPFEAFVVGEVKFGKSTLINALLGTEIAPTDFVPKTWCFNRYIAVDEPKDGVLILADPEEIQREPSLAAQLGDPIDDSRGMKVFLVSTADANKIMDEEEAKTLATLSSPTPYVSPILEMEWQVASNRAIVPGIRLVDTMGMNGMKERKGHLRYLAWQYARADAVIWVVSAKNLNSSGTREELESCSRYAKRIVLVINRWDEVEDRERLRQSALELYGEYATEIVFLSALAASVGVTNKPMSELMAKQRGPLQAFMQREGITTHEELLAHSGYPQLRSALTENLQGKFHLIRNESAYSALRRQQKEFRMMATRAKKDAAENLSTFRMLQEAVGQLDQHAANIIEARVQALQESLEKRLKQATMTLGYEDSESPEAKVSVELIRNIARVEQQKLADELEETYRTFLLEAADRSNYVFSEFAADGRVADTRVRKSVGVVTLDVAPLELDTLLAAADRDAFIKAYDMLENMPVIGTLANRLVGTQAEKRRAEIVEDLKTRIREDLEPKIIEMIGQIREHMHLCRQHTDANVRAEIERNAKALGTVEEQESRIAELDGIVSLEETAPFWLREALKGAQFAQQVAAAVSSNGHGRLNGSAA